LELSEDDANVSKHVRVITIKILLKFNIYIYIYKHTHIVHFTLK